MSSTINFVKYYFRHSHIAKLEPGEMEKLVALAYQTARDRKIYPKEVFIRHVAIKYHVTIGYKDQKQVNSGTHVASHGYVKDRVTLEFMMATHHPEKDDSTKTLRGKVTWPAKETLYEAPELGYSHLP